MLRLVLPKGSLERQTLQLFDDADLTVNRGSDVDYTGTIDDPRVDEVRILRPQEIPQYVADGLFDLGIAGRDCIEECNADVVTLTELHYSKATSEPAVARCPKLGWPEKVARISEIAPRAATSTETTAPATKIVARCS